MSNIFSQTWKHIFWFLFILIFDNCEIGLTTRWAARQGADPRSELYGCMFCFSLAFVRTRPAIGFGSRPLREKLTPLTYCSAITLRSVVGTNPIDLLIAHEEAFGHCLHKNFKRFIFWTFLCFFKISEANIIKALISPHLSTDPLLCWEVLQARIQLTC